MANTLYSYDEVLNAGQSSPAFTVKPFDSTDTITLATFKVAKPKPDSTNTLDHDSTSYSSDIPSPTLSNPISVAETYVDAVSDSSQETKTDGELVPRGRYLRAGESFRGDSYAGELSFQQGDVIEILAGTHEEPWAGGLDGHLGTVQSSHLVVSVRALENIESAEPDHLTMLRGDIIQVLDARGVIWWRGSLRESSGLFLRSEVVPINLISIHDWRDRNPLNKERRNADRPKKSSDSMGHAPDIPNTKERMKRKRSRKDKIANNLITGGTPKTKPNGPRRRRTRASRKPHVPKENSMRTVLIIPRSPSPVPSVNLELATLGEYVVQIHPLEVSVDHTRELWAKFAEEWCTEEFASMAVAFKDDLLRTIPKGEGTTIQVVILLVRAELGLAKLDRLRELAGSDEERGLPTWMESVRLVIEAVRQVLDQDLCHACSRIIPQLGWEYVGGWLRPNSRDDTKLERIQWIMESLKRGVSCRTWATAYEVLFTTVLSRPHPCGFGPLFCLDSPVRAIVQRTCDELVSWVQVGNRLADVRTLCTLERMPSSILSQLAEELNMTSEILLSPPVLAPRRTIAIKMSKAWPRALTTDGSGVISPLSGLSSPSIPSRSATGWIMA